MKYFSTFSGIGGFELGIINAYERLLDNRSAGEIKKEDNLEQDSPNTSSEYSRQPPACVGYSEIDKYASAIYQKHFPDHKNYGDITKINAEELPEFDLLVGGFPCQAFSIAGKRKGFDDTRGTLFFDLARILRAKQPRLFVFENVKGLLSHDNGRTFSTIISTLDELRYDLQWQVVNSKNHGVPQNRERIIIVGHLRGTPRPEVFPFGESNGNNQEANREYPSVSAPVTSQGQLNCRGVFIQQFGEFRNSDISPTLRTPTGGNRLPMVNEDSKIRRLTPVECERLQGFPDGWTESVSDTQRYKTLGNAVTVNVIRDVMEKLLK